MAEVHIALAAEKIAQIGPFPITNSMLTTWIVTLILLAFAYFATRKIESVPKGLQNVAEIMVEGLEGLVSSIAPPDKTKVFLPIIATFFFFIMFGNYFGLLPGVGSICFYDDHVCGVFYAYALRSCIFFFSLLMMKTESHLITCQPWFGTKLKLLLPGDLKEKTTQLVQADEER